MLLFVFSPQPQRATFRPRIMHVRRHPFANNGDPSRLRATKKNVRARARCSIIIRIIIAFTRETSPVMATPRAHARQKIIIIIIASHLHRVFMIKPFAHFAPHGGASKKWSSRCCRHRWRSALANAVASRSRTIQMLSLHAFFRKSLRWKLPSRG